MKILPYKIQSLEPLTITNTLHNKHIGDSVWPLLDFLFLHHQEYTKCIWNIDEFVAIVCSRLPEEDLEQMIHKGKARNIGPMNYKLFYIPNKLFSIEKRDTEVRFYGINQYFPKDYTPSESLEIESEQLMEALTIMKLYPTKLTSPVAIYEECMMPHLSLHTRDEFVIQVPKEAIRYIWHCVNDGWVEAYKVGFFKESYYYDINHAYPMAMMGLVNTKGGTWQRFDNYPPEYIDGLGYRIYGYCRGKRHINSNVTLHPISHVDSEGYVSRPTGDCYDYLPKSKIDFINYWQIGSFEIERGWWMYHNSPSYPLKNPMKQIIQWKLSDHPVVSVMGKSIGVGIWGKFGEEYRVGFGPWFNPCWFVEVPHLVDNRVCSFIYKNKLMDDVIHIKIDGILSRRMVEL